MCASLNELLVLYHSMTAEEQQELIEYAQNLLLDESDPES